MNTVEKPKITLAAARTNAGRNQRQWAEEIGVDLSTITNWEKGKTEPSASQLRKISELSGIPMDFYFCARTILKYKIVQQRLKTV